MTRGIFLCILFLVFVKHSFLEILNVGHEILVVEYHCYHKGNNRYQNIRGNDEPEPTVRADITMIQKSTNR